jgi:hypothetical protein
MGTFSIVFYWNNISHLWAGSFMLSTLLDCDPELDSAANYRIFRPIARALPIQKRSEIVKNEHARYTLERFPIDNAHVICTKKVSENTVLCIKHNFQLKLLCSIH